MKINKYIGMFALLVLFGAGCEQSQQKVSSSKAVSSTEATNDGRGGALDLTMSEVANYRGGTNGCWIVVDGIVYAPVENAKNGYKLKFSTAVEDIIFKSCGTDITATLKAKGLTNSATTVLNENYRVGKLGEKVVF